MKIDPNGHYSGLSLVRLRDALRSTGGEAFRPAYLRERLALSPDQTGRLLASLLEDGLLQAEPARSGYFRLTLDGTRLSRATAAPRVSRATAEKAVEAFLDRVEEVQSSSDYLFRVAHVKVFGSYLTDATRLSDVDLCVVLQSKHPAERLAQLMNAQIEAAIADGRRFPNLAQRYYWPKTLVLRFLKSGSRVLSVTDGDDGILDRTEWRYLYRDPGVHSEPVDRRE